MMQTPIELARSLPDNAQPAVVDQTLRDISRTQGFEPKSLDNEVYDVLAQKSGWDRNRIEQKFGEFHTGAGSTA